jgi:precorrin-6B methylase 2
MLWRAYALLSHGGDRIGLRPWRVDTAPRALQRPSDVLQTLTRLDEAVWTANALAAAAESGLIGHLQEPATPDALAERIGAPPALARGLIDVLASLGFVQWDQDRVCASRALAPFTSASGSTTFAAALKAPLLQGEDLRCRARDRELDLRGWSFEDAAIIEAQGALTGLWVEKAAPKLKFLPGLTSRLEEPGAALLDVGAGAAGLSIALCRRFPHLRATALEPAPQPAAVGERHVREAGLLGRISIRRQQVEHLVDEQAYDLAFLPQMFLPEQIMQAAVQRVFRALKPGGWLLVAVLARPGSSLAATVARLKNLLWGGNARDMDALKPLLVDTGFQPVIRAPGGDVIRMICARRPPA